MSILQYLTRYAEPESSCKAPQRNYKHTVIIPAFDEPISLLEGLRPATTNRTDALWILVVNSPETGAYGAESRTQLLLGELLKHSEALSFPGIRRVRHEIGDLVIVDRCSNGRRIPNKQGVGLARKIGCDLALSWYHQGSIESPWIHSTDADVVLPGDYFSAVDPKRYADDVVALTYPFWHITDPSTRQGQALELYELSLRYYRFGLAWAGSTYGFHSVGSTMAIRSSAYAAIRGMPKRSAGEDFYLLNKAAKLGLVAIPDCSPIQIRQRESSRTPFGTGPATQKIRDLLSKGESFKVYHPSSFTLLRKWLHALDEFANHRDISVIDRMHAPLLSNALPVDTREHLLRASLECRTPNAVKQRIRQWFDGFRTLKLFHTLRDQGLANQPWPHAVAAAPFVPQANNGQSLRASLAAAEQNAPSHRTV